MNRSTLVSTLALCGLLAAGNAVAQIPSGTSPAPAAKANKPTAPGSTFGASGGKDPVKIDADRARRVRPGEQGDLRPANVVAVQGDSTIRCSTMTVHYKRGKDAKPGAPAPATDGTKSPAGMAENGIQKVECAGPVTVVQNDQVATGDNAVFDQEAKRIVLTGNVVLSQCQNVTRGSRLVYDMNTGRANMDPMAGGRVSAMFVPQKEEAAKGGAKGCAQPASAAGKPAPKPSEASADKPTAKPRAQAN